MGNGKFAMPVATTTAAQHECLKNERFPYTLAGRLSGTPKPLGLCKENMVGNLL